MTVLQDLLPMTVLSVGNLMPLIVKRGRILGFSVRYYEHRLPDYIAEMSAWLRLIANPLT